MILTFELALTCYFAAAIISVGEIIKGSRALSKICLILCAIGFIFHTINVILRFKEAGHLPIASMHDAVSFFTWSIVLLFFVIEYKYRIGLLGSFIMPGVFVFMLSSSILPRQLKPLDPLLQSSWLWIHTVLAFIGDAAFALACGVGIMYLTQERFVKRKKLGNLFHRLPSLQKLDEINHRLITIGFPLLTLAIITGAVWSQSVLGTFWRWDPKEVWSLITWLIYAVVLHTRITSWGRGRRAAVLSVVGFVVVLFTFFGVTFLLKGYHRFS
ncbi:MAG: c-type cytochrome biogenesis protein CcsB [Candidatus Magnetoovum sp. WYHC-5]|nr:c-type cytochrome biogenesis protein CcsB [Candidatus Magnetoovum sp. WYHC-5]